MTATAPIKFENVFSELCSSLAIGHENVATKEIPNKDEIRYSAEGIGDSYRFTYDLTCSLDKEPQEKSLFNDLPDDWYTALHNE